MGVEGEHRTWHLTRRELLKGGVAVAGILLFGDGVRNLTSVREQKSRQLDEARRMVEAQGITQPTPEEENSATQLREEITRNPLAKRNPDEMEQARQILKKQEDFNNASGRSFYEIRNKEGSSDVKLVVGCFEVFAGATAVGVAPIIPH